MPWQLGAALFPRHLLDNDPASSTLSWRWMAGLHTRGKAYAATTENIRRYTEGRFSPASMNEPPEPLHEPAPQSDAAPHQCLAASNVALLLSWDDLHPENLPLGGARVVRPGQARGVPGWREEVTL